MKRLYICFLIFFPLCSFAEIYNGTTGVCKWTYDSYSGLLTISGNGEMSNYETYNGFSRLTSRVKSLVIKDGVTNIGDNAFYDCYTLTSIEIPNSVTSIGASAFHNCTGLTSIEIPNSVTSIGKSAFQSCSRLTSLSIGSNVLYINDKAFANCSYILDIYCFAQDVPKLIGEDVFSGSYIEYATLHIPAESVLYYSKVPIWGTVHKIIPLTEDDYVKYNYDGNKNIAKQRDVSDVNGDGNVDISDIVFIINEIANPSDE